VNDADDSEWLLARERGEDVSHVPAETRARYDRLTRLIEALPDRAPSPGWKQRVLDAMDAPGALDATEPPAMRTIAPRRRTWAIAGTAAAAAASVVVVIALRRGDDLMAEPIVTIDVRRGNDLYRGRDVSVGDTLVVRAEADHPIELRLYGDAGEPLARCGETAGCTVVRDGKRRRYTLEVVLRARGDLRAVLFSALDTALPAPQDLDADLAAAQGARIEARQLAVMHVQ
jgi:hypothetical protein